MYLDELLELDGLALLTGFLGVSILSALIISTVAASAWIAAQNEYALYVQKAIMSDVAQPADRKKFIFYRFILKLGAFGLLCIVSSGIATLLFWLPGQWNWGVGVLLGLVVSYNILKYVEDCVHISELKQGYHAYDAKFRAYKSIVNAAGSKTNLYNLKRNFEHEMHGALGVGHMSKMGFADKTMSEHQTDAYKEAVEAIDKLLLERIYAKDDSKH